MDVMIAVGNISESLPFEKDATDYLFFRAYQQVSGDNEKKRPEDILKYAAAQEINNKSADDGSRHGYQRKEKPGPIVDAFQAAVGDGAGQGVKKGYRQGNTGDGGRSFVRIEEKQDRHKNKTTSHTDKCAEGPYEEADKGQ